MIKVSAVFIDTEVYEHNDVDGTVAAFDATSVANMLQVFDAYTLGIPDIEISYKPLSWIVAADDPKTASFIMLCTYNDASPVTIAGHAWVNE